MRRTKKARALSVLLVVFMLISMLPVAAFADGDTPPQEEPTPSVKAGQAKDLPANNAPEEAPKADPPTEKKASDKAPEKKEETGENPVGQSPEKKEETNEKPEGENPDTKESADENPAGENPAQKDETEEQKQEPPAPEPAGEAAPEEAQDEDPEDPEDTEEPEESIRKDSSVTIHKTDENNQPLADAVFTIYTDAACGETDAVKTFSAGTYTLSTADPLLASLMPAPGSSVSLYLKETKAPEGYRAEANVHKITIRAEADQEAAAVVYTMTIGDDGRRELTVVNKSAEALEEARLALAAEAPSADLRDLNPGLGSIRIPFTKLWDGSGDSEATRPASITISLYKYLGTFDISTAALVETKTLSAASGWGCEFDISSQSLSDGTNTYKWAVVESKVPGYQETAHTDPNVIFNPPEVAGGGWGKITPCNEVDITTSGNAKSIVCAKKGNRAIVWSVDPLSEAERQMIMASAKAGIDGLGNPSFSFYSGYGSLPELNMTVTPEQIQFSKPSDWSLLALGLYIKSSAQANASSITNSYQPAAAALALPVTKAIQGTPAAAASFTFTLQAVTEGAPMPANGGTLTITGAGNGSFGVITYTVPGTWEYTVSETKGTAAGYTYDPAVYHVTVTVTDEQGKLKAVSSVRTSAGIPLDTITFTNTYTTGNLVVTKTLAGNAPAADQKFRFTVKLSDTAINGMYGNMNFTNGEATFELTGGQSMKAQGLPSGVTYTVTEDDYTTQGYVTVKSGDSGTIVAGGEVTAAFTNTRNAEGSLTITKQLAGNDTDSSKEFTFTITLSNTAVNGTFGDVTFTNGTATLTLKGSQSKTITGLPNGTEYTVTEADYSGEGYIASAAGSTGRIDEHTPAAAVFTNERNTYGDLIVKKLVEGNAPIEGKNFRFTVKLSDTAISGTYGGMLFQNGEATFTLKAGEERKAQGLPNGVTFTVTEEDYHNEGYTTQASGDTGTIRGGDTLMAVFTNTRNAAGSLTITKQLAGNHADKEKDFVFTITLSDSAIHGIYSGITFTNGTATITLKGGQSKSIEGLPNGTAYTVTEADYSADGYTTSQTGAMGTIRENVPAAAAFVNTRDTFGHLIVKKITEGNAPIADKVFRFRVTLSDKTISGPCGAVTFVQGTASFQLKGGQMVKIENLPNGVTYTVTEDDYSGEGYTTVKTGDTGTIVGDDTMTAVFTNTRNAAGSLTITKQLAGNDTDSTKEFAFTIKLLNSTLNGTYSGVAFTNGTAAITLKGGQSKTITGLPNGTEYLVTEADYTNDGYTASATGSTGRIDEHTPAVAVFTNKRDTFGDLVVRKTVEGNALIPDQAFTFTVTLSDRSISGTYGDMRFTDGTAAFQLKGGEEATAKNLPNGVGFAVTEADYTNAGYVTTKTGDTGTIVGNITKTAYFTNTRNAEGSLTISKKLAGNAPDANKAFTFTIQLLDHNDPISGTFGDITFTNGTASITLKGGQSKVITGLPNGIEYTVTEADYTNDGYTTTATGDVGVIDEKKAAVAEFTNRRDTFGDLIVQKTVAGNAPVENKAFAFTVTLSNHAINGTYGDMTFANGVAVFSLKGGEKRTAKNLPNGVSYLVTEADYSNEGYETTMRGERGTIAGGNEYLAYFINTRNTVLPPMEYGDLIIKKRVTGDLADYSKYFSFTVIFSADGRFEYTGSASGSISSGDTILLKHGQSITIHDLPAGTVYSVTESGNTGYRVYVSGDTGTIAANKTLTAAFTNTKSKVPVTGDDSQLPLWLGLTGIAGMGMFLTAWLERKRRREWHQTR